MSYADQFAADVIAYRCQHIADAREAAVEAGRPIYAVTRAMIVAAQEWDDAHPQYASIVFWDAVAS